MDTPTQLMKAQQAIYWFRRKQLKATQKLTRIKTKQKVNPRNGYTNTADESTTGDLLVSKKAIVSNTKVN